MDVHSASVLAVVGVSKGACRKVTTQYKGFFLVQSRAAQPRKTPGVTYREAPLLYALTGSWWRWVQWGCGMSCRVSGLSCSVRGHCLIDKMRLVRAVAFPILM